MKKEFTREYIAEKIGHRYDEWWAERGLRPFSEEEMAAIRKYNDFLRQLSDDTISRAFAVARQMATDIANGFTHFSDFTLEAQIEIDQPDDDSLCGPENLAEQLVRATSPFTLCTVSEEDSPSGYDYWEQYWRGTMSGMEYIAVGNHLDEVWDRYHVHLSMTFDHFFGNEHTYTIADMLNSKIITPEQFVPAIHVYL